MSSGAKLSRMIITNIFDTHRDSKIFNIAFNHKLVFGQDAKYEAIGQAAQADVRNSQMSLRITTSFAAAGA